MTINDQATFYHKEIEPYMENLFVGLFVIFVLINFTEYICLGFIHSLGFVEFANISAYPFNSLVYNLIINILSALAVWFIFFIRYPKFEIDEVGIAIALTKRDEKVDAELKKLYQQLEELVNSEGLKTRIVIRILPDRLKPKDINIASRLVKKLRARLVIWGNVDYGRKDSINQTVFVPIHFTYELNLRPNDALSFGQGIKHVLANRNWFVRDDHNIIDRDYLARNTQEVSLYIIGSVLFFAKRYDESLEILRKTLQKYKTKNTLSPDDSVAIANLRNLLSSLYHKMGNDTDLRPDVKDRERNILKMKDIVSKMTEDGFMEGALTLDAQIEFAQNHVSARGKKLLKDAHALNPSNPAQCFSLAFLYFYEGDLKNGHLWLENALNRKNSPTMIDQIPVIITWYEKAYEEDSSKEWLCFPLGVLCWIFLKDEKNSKSSLETFLAKYGQSSDPSLRPIISYTKQILKKIRKK